MNESQRIRILSIQDLAKCRLDNGPLDPNVHHDLTEIVRISAELLRPFRHYPEGMGEESRRLHREYAALEKAQRAGAKNGAEVVRLTDECAAKGIILVPGGEYL